MHNAQPQPGPVVPAHPAQMNPVIMAALAQLLLGGQAPVFDTSMMAGAPGALVPATIAPPMVETVAKIEPWKADPYSSEFLAEIEKLAEAAFKSKLYGDSTKEQLVMILATGRELGLQPTVALRNIRVFRGTLITHTQLQVSLVKNAGYLVEILENTPEVARVRISKDGKNPYEPTYTIEDAKKAGLIQRNALYTTNPATMILNRALGLACRYGAPEVLNGLHADIELEELVVTTDPNAPKAPEPPTGEPKAEGEQKPPIPAEKGGAPAGGTTRRRTAAPKAQEPAAAAPAPTTATPAPAAPQGATQGQGGATPTTILPYPWTPKRQDWMVTRGMELGFEEAWMRETVIPVLDKAGNDARQAFHDFLKDPAGLDAGKALIEKLAGLV